MSIRILHISTAVSWRGGEQQLAYLLEELKNKDCTQFVFCYQHSAIEKHCQSKGISYYSVPRKSAFHPVQWYQIHQCSKEKKIEVIHVHDAHAHTAAILACTFMGLKLPIVLSRKVDFPIRNNSFSRFKYNHPALKRIICVSKKIMEILAVDLSKTAKLKCIYDGIDLQKFSLPKSNSIREELTLAQDMLLVGNVAALADHKDYYTFVDTAELLVNKGLNAHFVIIGDGPERDGIRNYIKEKKLNDRIHMLGFRDNIGELLPQLNLFLFTSKTEGLGSSILDAYASQVPVVATSAGGVPEIVQDSVSGLLAPVKDPHSLANQCLRVVSDENLRTNLIKNARHFVQSFSKERMANATFDVYQEVLSEMP